ncbi:Por secretion system C-terminal sorting domain-containing protein [Chryseolinea serpens]|uniref:Por secretion system C-terminal sorting domain-containing protein n=2 Tax=Chryseolinea serpens TaxID=947013 RepID=A0A1M5JHQ2_9BACT|nr:Por secretion system C-terminal sorting domain-containing protein [Chryseolinea serpens]
MMKRTLLLIAALGFLTMDLWGQAIGDYRSAGSGPWSTVGTWQTFNGTSWVAAGAAPTSANGAITIRSPHIVTVAAGVTIDQTTIDVGGTLTVNSGINLTLANGAGDEITVNGTINVHGGIVFGAIPNRTIQVAGTFNNDANLTVNSTILKLFFLSGSVYNHQYTSGGAVLLATWNSNSTTNIVGLGAGPITAPTNLNQTFGNLVWNCPNQASDNGFIDMGGFPVSIAGDFRIIDTGSDALFHSLGAGGVLTVGADLEVSGGTFAFASGVAGTLNVVGGVAVSGTGYIQFADDQDLDMTVNGDFSLTGGGQVDFAATTAITTYHHKGNYTQTGGSIFTSGGVSNISFEGTTTQVYTSTLLPIGGTINYSIATGSTVSLAGNNFFGGAGTFTLSDGGVLQVGSTDALGAIQTGPSGGNIRVTGTRTFASGSRIVYNGTAAQFIGAGHPSSAGITTEITNTNGVSLATNVTFSGGLILNGGNLSVGIRTLTLAGDFSPGVNSINVTSSSNIAITGNGLFASNPGGTMPLAGTAPLTINNFTMSRTGGRVYVFDDLTVNGTFTLTNGVIDIRGFLFTMNGNIALSGGAFAVNEFARMQVTGTGTITGSASFQNESSGSLPMLAMAMNRPSSTFTIGSNLDLSILNLTVGAFNPGASFRMGSGGTITRTDGTITTAPGAVSSYNVIYNGSSNISTGPELPYDATSTTRLTDLTNSGTGTISLSQATTVNGTLTLTNGTFDATTSGITFKGNIVSNAAGIFTNSAVIFDGTTVISGSIALSLGAFTVNSSHTLNLGTGTTVNIASNVTNNGSIYGGTSTTIFNGNTTITNNLNRLLLASFHNVQVTGTLKLDLDGFLEPTPDSALYRIRVSGSWDTQTGTFTPGVSRVDFNGTTAQTIAAAGQSFFSVYFTGTGPFVLSRALRALNDINIGSTSTLDVSTNSHLVTVAEDFIVDGTFLAQQGTVQFNGIGTIQSITRTTGSGPITLYSMTVNKTGTANPVNILTNVDIQHFLNVSSATTVNAGTNLLRLLSNASFTARVTPITAGGLINGSVIVQRYMPNTAGANSFRYLSAPVTGTTVTDWRGEIPITSIFYYDETFNTGAATLEARYRQYTLTGALTPQGRGYAAAVNSTGAQTFDSRGTLGQSAVPINVTAHSAGGLDGWNLIGNPYPSAIDWNQVTIPAGLNDAIYISDNFNNSGQGTGLHYVSYVGGVPSVQNYAGIIAQGQAFWVRATANTTLTLQEDDKTLSAAQFFREDSASMVIPNLLRISMIGTGLSDETVLRLHKPATDGFDKQFDAYKLLNAKLSLSTVTTDNQSLSINSMGSLDCDKKIPLAMVGAVKGSYSLAFTGLETFNANLNLYLVDVLQNTSINIRDVQSYGFTVTATDLPNLSKRFYVTVGKAAVKTDLKTMGESICVDNTLANVTIEQSQADVQYAIQYNDQTTDFVVGNGNTISLPVSTTLLTAGDNTVTILAKSSSCLTLPLSTKPVITVVGKGVVASTREGNTCDAGSVTLSATGAPESGWYNWYEGETDTTPIAGQQGATFTTPVIPKTKTYFVSVVNAAGCEGDRVAVKANVTILDPVTLSGEGTTLISSYATGNQWYRDGVALEGATTNKIEAVESGVYTVEVTSGDCKTSASREVTITGSEAGLSGFGTVTIYPNPTQRKALVRVKTTNKNVIATLINASGVDLEERELKGDGGVKEAEFDLGTSAIGVYYVLIVDGSKKYTEKIVKIK